jgi:hypothetical protein
MGRLNPPPLLKDMNMEILFWMTREGERKAVVRPEVETDLLEQGWVREEAPAKPRAKAGKGE